MSTRFPAAIAVAVLVLVAPAVWAQDAATRIRSVQAECEAKVQAGNMNYSACASTCKAYAMAASQMPPAQAQAFVNLCTTARDNAARQEATQNAEVEALEKRREEARQAAEQQKQIESATPQAQQKPAAAPKTAAPPKQVGGLLTELGRETDYKFIDAVFRGEFQGIDPLSLRFTYMGYVTASDEKCRTNTPNGTRDIVMTTEVIKKNRWGMEVDRYTTRSRMHVDNLLFDRVWQNLHTSPPGVNILNAGAYTDVLSAIETDYMRLFNTWKCAGPEIRQFQENLHRAAEGQRSLQAERDSTLPLPVVVQQACDAYVQSPTGDPSGYRLKSCACLAEHTTGKAFNASELTALGAQVDARQVVLLAYARKLPAMPRACLTKETRTGGGAMARSGGSAAAPRQQHDIGLVLRQQGYEFRAPVGEPWCGLLTARLDLFYDRKDYDLGARVRSAAVTFVDDLLPLFNAQCPKATLLQMEVYSYGSAELLEEWAFRWAPNGDWVRRTSAIVPSKLTNRANIVYAPATQPQPAEVPAPSRAPSARAASTASSQECGVAVMAAQESALGTDYCAVTPAQVKRASEEMSRIQQSALCAHARGVHPPEAIQFTVDNRCKVQREGGVSEEEARLLERARNKQGCRPISDPDALATVANIKRSMNKSSLRNAMAAVYPVFPSDTAENRNGKACAADYLLQTWMGNRSAVAPSDE